MPEAAGTAPGSVVDGSPETCPPPHMDIPGVVDIRGSGVIPGRLGKFSPIFA